MRRSHEISNSDDVIDSRDVIQRIDELRDEIDAAGVPDNEIGGPKDTVNVERDELAALESLAEEAAQYSEDWKYGAMLVRDSYFVDYAQQLAEDVCEMPSDVKWPYTCIDWDKAADELKVDYTSVEFGDVTYWVR